MNANAEFPGSVFPSDGVYPVSEGHNGAGIVVVGPPAGGFHIYGNLDLTPNTLTIAGIVPPEIPPTSINIPLGSVVLNPSGQDMLASFTPYPGVSLSQAAAAGGFTHFDWMQVGEHYPGRGTPFIDPPPGGYNGQPADDLPFYWDETSVPGAEPGYQLSDNIHGNVLQFLDTPEDSFVIPGLNYMEFYTSLVGIRADGSWTPLFSWSWESDSSPIIPGGSVILLRNIFPLSGATGGVLVSNPLATPTSVPADVLNIWEQNGATVAVPEPATWLFMLGGLFALGGNLRRKRSSSNRRSEGVGLPDHRCPSRYSAPPAHLNY